MRRELEMSCCSVGWGLKCPEHHLPGGEDGSRGGRQPRQRPGSFGQAGVREVGSPAHASTGFKPRPGCLGKLSACVFCDLSLGVGLKEA